MLRKGIVAGGLVWTAPVVISTIEARPALASGLPGPQQGSATVVCDGLGGYRVALNGWAGAPCGIVNCITIHEQSHITDWMARFPLGCKNANGTNKPDGTAPPTGGPGYAAFLRASECSAYTAELTCIEGNNRTDGDCPRLVALHLADTARQKARYCR